MLCLEGVLGRLLGWGGGAGGAMMGDNTLHYSQPQKNWKSLKTLRSWNWSLSQSISTTFIRGRIVRQFDSQL